MKARDYLAGLFLAISIAGTVFAAKYYSSFQHLDLKGLTKEQTGMVLDLLNHNNCKCGCTKGSLANCVETDIHCSQSKFLSQEIVDKAKAGKSREYLMGVIDGFDHAKKHTRSEKKKKNDPNKIYDVKVGAGVFKGPRNAPITLVEFSDYQCPFCRRGHDTVKKLLQKYPDKIKLYVRNHPLPFHKLARPAAMAALAAEQQGKFWEMYDLLFSGKGLAEKNLLEYAGALNLDMERFKADLKNPVLSKRISDDTAEARRLGASGTPAYFLNGRYLRGAKPLGSFAQLVEKLLKVRK
ncbi:MAG: DsbA family protein [bacterium]